MRCSMNAQERETYIVWVGNADRIASFSKVEGYEKKIFSNHEFFMSFLHGLQERGYRFQ